MRSFYFCSTKADVDYALKNERGSGVEVVLDTVDKSDILSAKRD